MIQLPPVGTQLNSLSTIMLLCHGYWSNVNVLQSIYLPRPRSLSYAVTVTFLTSVLILSDFECQSRQVTPLINHPPTNHSLVMPLSADQRIFSSFLHLISIGPRATRTRKSTDLAIAVVQPYSVLLRQILPNPFISTDFSSSVGFQPRTCRIKNS